MEEEVLVAIRECNLKCIKVLDQIFDAFQNIA